MVTSVILLLGIVASIFGFIFIACAFYDFYSPLAESPTERAKKNLRYLPMKFKKVRTARLLIGSSILLGAILGTIAYFVGPNVEKVDHGLLATGGLVYAVIFFIGFLGLFDIVSGVQVSTTAHGEQEVIPYGPTLARPEDEYEVLAPLAFVFFVFWSAMLIGVAIT